MEGCSALERLLVDLLEDVEYVDGARLVEIFAQAVDRNTSRIDGLEARVGLVELGHDMSDDRLMWVALDERLLALEVRQAQLLQLAERLLQAVS